MPHGMHLLTIGFEFSPFFIFTNCKLTYCTYTLGWRKKSEILINTLVTPEKLPFDYK